MRFISTYYPASDEVNPDDFVLPEYAAPVSTEQITTEGSAREIPPGDHLLEVVGFQGTLKTEFHAVTLDGMATGFNAQVLQVKLALPNDKGCGTIDRFVLPPSTPEQLRAYWHGLSGNAKVGGFQARRFAHFVARLFNLEWTAGMPLPESCRALATWKGRKIVATVEAGRSYYREDPTTLQQVEKKGFNQIKLFSYRSATTHTSASAPPSTTPHPGSPTTARHPGPPTTARRPTPQQAIHTAIGLEDI